MIRRILVGLGGTPFTEVAVSRATELARIHGARVTGVTVVDMDQLRNVGPVPLGGAAYAQQMKEQRVAITEERVEEAIASFERQCAAAGVAHSVERETGRAFDLMISHARYHDLTIFGLRSLFDYGITSEPNDALIKLVDNGVRPLVAVSLEFREIRKALIAYSGSMQSAKTMRRFVQMRPWPDARLEIVHFGERSQGEALLAAATDYCAAHGYEVESRVLEGGPDDGILAYADRTGADIVVMGGSVRSTLARKIIGSTCLTTIRNADRPLFLAR